MGKQLVLDIEENKFEALYSFLKTLDYVSISGQEEIPEWQKQEVARRLKLIEEGKMKTQSWADAKKEIFKK